MPHTSKKKVIPLDRFFNKIKVVNGCWEWQGSKTYGYGSHSVNGKTVRAHRFAYESLVGPIPEGLQIDHLCRNRCCVNPEHLEPVTARENIMRGDLPRVISERMRGKTHCPSGHPYSEENTYITPSTKGRNCRICMLNHQREWRKKQRAIKGPPIIGYKIPVQQITKDGKTIKVWPSVKEAALTIGLGRKGITDCARGLYKQCGGYVWRFVIPTFPHFTYQLPTPKQLKK